MKTVLADTSALVALADADDHGHRAVSDWFRQTSDSVRLIVTTYVFDECMTLMKSKFGAEAAVAFGQRLRSSQFCRFVHVTPQDEAATWQIFARYTDKGWSYTDCSVPVVSKP